MNEMVNIGQCGAFVWSILLFAYLWLIAWCLLFHSELFEVNHIRTIYHMFIALLIIFILSTLVVDFIDEGR